MKEPEEFRYSGSGVGGMLLFGALLIVAGVALAVVGARTPRTVSVGYGVGGICVLLGAILAVTAWRRRHRLVSITDAGITFDRDGELVPWAKVQGLELTDSGQQLSFLDGAGRLLGKVPTAVGGLQRLLLLAVDRIPGPNAPPGKAFTGGHGVLAWSILSLGVLGNVIHFATGAGSGGKGWAALLAALSLSAAFSELRRLWRHTGATEVRIHQAGIEFRGRSGDWAVRWGEVEVILAAVGDPHDQGVGFHLLTNDRRELWLPLAGVDLLHALQEMKRHGGDHWTKLVARSGRGVDEFPDLPDAAGYDEIPGEEFMRRLLRNEEGAQKDPPPAGEGSLRGGG